MATWSEWFKHASLKGINLEECLHFDPQQDFERLYSSGLPVYDRFVIYGADYHAKKDEFLSFCQKYPLLWIRIYDSISKVRKYSKFGITGKEALDYVNQIDSEISPFELQVYECHENKYGGNVLTNAEGTCIELIDGPQDIVGKSLKPFYHANIGQTGRLEFVESNAPDDIKRTAWKVLAHLKLSRSEFLPGYFEFIVSEADNVYFLDYKTTLR